MVYTPGVGVWAQFLTDTLSLNVLTAMIDAQCLSLRLQNKWFKRSVGRY